MLDPAKTSYSAPLGRQHEDSYDYLLVKDKKIVGHNAGLTDKSSPVWSFTVEDQQNFAPELQVLHGLLMADFFDDLENRTPEWLKGAHSDKPSTLRLQENFRMFPGNRQQLQCRIARFP